MSYTYQHWCTCHLALLYKALQNELLQFWPDVSETRGLEVPRPYQVMPKYGQKSFSMTKTNTGIYFKKYLQRVYLFGNLIICWGKCGGCLGGAVHTLIPGAAAAAAASADLPPSHTDSTGAGVRASRPVRARVRSRPACRTHRGWASVATAVGLGSLASPAAAAGGEAAVASLAPHQHCLEPGPTVRETGANTLTHSTLLA